MTRNLRDVQERVVESYMGSLWAFVYSRTQKKQVIDENTWQVDKT